MRESPTHPRRRLLGGVAGVLATGVLAGCLGDDSGPEDGDESDGGSPTNDSTDDDTGSDGSDDSESGDDGDSDTSLDLREANVVDVAFEAGNGSYEFDVSLHHDDDSEDGYANWWQVERLDGTELGRRELTHAHSEQPFTRSATIEIPADVTCVVVRGHDQTHEYGGQVILVSLDSGTTDAIDQGTDRQSFAESDCP